MGMKEIFTWISTWKVVLERNSHK